MVPSNTLVHNQIPDTPPAYTTSLILHRACIIKCLSDLLIYAYLISTELKKIKEFREQCLSFRITHGGQFMLICARGILYTVRENDFSKQINR